MPLTRSTPQFQSKPRVAPWPSSRPGQLKQLPYQRVFTFSPQAFKLEKRSTPRHSAHFTSSPLKRRRSPFPSHKSDHYNDSGRNETTLVNEHHQHADDPNSGEQEAFDSDDTFFIWNEENTLFSDLMGDKWARIVQFIALVQHLFPVQGNRTTKSLRPLLNPYKHRSRKKAGF